jgi:hypothetical protein
MGQATELWQDVDISKAPRRKILVISHSPRLTRGVLAVKDKAK